MAVKIIIEPIFEADFQHNSYGFRPKRSAHQAVEDVKEHLIEGKTDVIDADISKYFDTIPHDRLMQLVAKRIVDKQILKLIRMWLKAPIVEEREDRKKEYKGKEKGTPQGGVISPLLANIYLNVLKQGLLRGLHITDRNNAFLYNKLNNWYKFLVLGFFLYTRNYPHSRNQLYRKKGLLYFKNTLRHSSLPTHPYFRFWPLSYPSLNCLVARKTNCACAR
jgi:retron-type reverse transcriptase